MSMADEQAFNLKMGVRFPLDSLAILYRQRRGTSHRHAGEWILRIQPHAKVRDPQKVDEQARMDCRSNVRPVGFRGVNLTEE